MNKVRHYSLWLVMACVCATLSGCGQKGPLVLPDKAPTNSSTKAPQNSTL